MSDAGLAAMPAGCPHAFLAHIKPLRYQGVDAHFSVGVPIDAQVRQMIAKLSADAWYPAIEADGQVRDGAELTGLLYGYSTHLPADTRYIVRRERPHPSPAPADQRRQPRPQRPERTRRNPATTSALRHACLTR